MMTSIRRWLLIFCVVPTLCGCGVELPFLLAATGIGVGAKIALDRRPVSVQLADLEIESAANGLIRQLYQGNVAATSFNRVVLLTGQVPNTPLALSIEKNIRSLVEVRHVHNQLYIGATASAGARANDSWITTKVKSSFAGDRDINARDITVVTELGVVYLMVSSPLKKANALEIPLSQALAG